ncbi:hypothetical protein HK096_010345 [Nowakowskiella sp. JEL0078]|nr:hypothetical protein HK096_010345 [Nowakowskiella sp. JEL0078]
MSNEGRTENESKSNTPITPSFNIIKVESFEESTIADDQNIIPSPRIFTQSILTSSEIPVVQYSSPNHPKDNISSQTQFAVPNITLKTEKSKQFSNGTLLSFESYLKNHAIQNSLHQAIVHDYESLIQELEGDETTQKFKHDYEKMFNSVLKSKERGNKLFSKFQDLHAEYTTNHVIAQESLKGEVQDIQTMKTLKEQILAAEEYLETSNKREEVAKEELRLLKQEISQLSATMKQGVGLSVVQERTLNDLIQSKEQSTRELEHELDKIVKLRIEIADISENIRITDGKKRDLEKKIYDLKDKNSQKKADIDSEMRMKERLERDLRELRVVVSIKSQEVRAKQETVNRATDDISILETQIKSQKQMLDRLLKDQESLIVRTAKLQQDCDEQSAQTNEIADENEQIARDLKIKEADLSKNRTESRKMTKLKEALIKKNRALEVEKAEAEDDRKNMRTRNAATEIEIENMRKTTEADKKIVDDQSREKEILIENLTKAETETQKSMILTSLHRQTWHNLELELQTYRKEASSRSKVITQLKEDRDAYVGESMRLQTLFIQGLQSIKEKELQIFEYKKKTVQADTKLKHQQNLYEAVQSDRNLHSKHLIESQGEIAEMKRRLKVMNFQINGFKEDINSKEDALMREIAENLKLVKDTEIITDEIKTLKNQNDLAQTYVRQQLNEEVKLNQFVKEADMERTRQENAVQVLISERDNLSSQLIRQNEELTKLYDRIKTQQSSLIRSEKHFKDRLTMILEIREQIIDLKKKKRILEKDTAKTGIMKHVICRFRNDLIREETRMKALEEELQNPVNVHRWRKLEGSNPKAFEMIQLLHTLQKKLIAKHQEDTEKENLIQNREQKYLKLKSILAKQVGPEALEQVSEFQQIMKDKSLQLKHMGTELNMYQAQVREYRYMVFQIDNELGDVRNQYIQLARGRLFDAVERDSRKQTSIYLPPLPSLTSRYNSCGSLHSEIGQVNKESKVIELSQIEISYDNNKHELTPLNLQTLQGFDKEIIEDGNLLSPIVKITEKSEENVIVSEKRNFIEGNTSFEHEGSREEIKMVNSDFKISPQQETEVKNDYGQQNEDMSLNEKEEFDKKN